MAGILSPDLLVNNIPLTAEIMSVMVLVVFDDYVSGELIFPVVDKIKKYAFKILKMQVKRKHHSIARYAAEFLATALFIAYFVFGYFILSEYFFTPVLTRLKNVLLLVIIVTFVVLSWFFNNKDMRKKYLYG